MIVYVVGLDKMVVVVAGFVRQGVTFECAEVVGTLDGIDKWEIKFTGGF